MASGGGYGGVVRRLPGASTVRLGVPEVVAAAKRCCGDVRRRDVARRRARRFPAHVASRAHVACRRSSASWRKEPPWAPCQHRDIDGRRNQHLPLAAPTRPRSHRDHYATPNVGSVISRQPPNPMIAVAPPMRLTQRSIIATLAPLRGSAAAGDVPPIPGRVRERPVMRERPVQGVVGDLRPPPVPAAGVVPRTP